MGKRIFLITGYLMLALVFFSYPVYAEGASLSLTPDDISGKKAGDTFTILVQVEDVTDLYGVQIKLSYNANHLQVNDADSGKTGINARPLGAWSNKNQCYLNQNEADNQAGLLKFTAVMLKPAEPVQGSADIMEVTFKVKQEGKSTISISKDSILGNSKAERISYTTSDVSVENGPDDSSGGGNGSNGGNGGNGGSGSGSGDEEDENGKGDNEGEDNSGKDSNGKSGSQGSGGSGAGVVITWPQTQPVAEKSQAAQGIGVTINGIKTGFPDVTPVIRQNFTMVPVRFISQGLGFDVNWDGKEKKITITNQGKKVVLWVTGKKVYINGTAANLDVAPFLLNDKTGNSRTMVPLRFISQAFGCRVNWDHVTKMVSIDTGE